MSTKAEKFLLLYNKYKKFMFSGSDADQAAPFSVIYDLTRMIPTLLDLKIGSKTKPIRKVYFLGRKSLVHRVMDEFAYIPKLMPGVEVDESFETILFSLKDNRKSDGRRFVSVVDDFTIEITVISDLQTHQNVFFGQLTIKPMPI